MGEPSGCVVGASLAPDAPVTGRYLTVWLTALPSVEDGFRGEVAEIAVRG